MFDLSKTRFFVIVIGLVIYLAVLNTVFVQWYPNLYNSNFTDTDTTVTCALLYKTHKLTNSILGLFFKCQIKSLFVSHICFGLYSDRMKLAQKQVKESEYQCEFIILYWVRFFLWSFLQQNL